MKIEQLVQVIEIAKTRSITLAAKNLYMSQSNLSTSIRELEKEMKQNIFVRSNNGTQLTPFGEAFLIQARSVVKQFEYIKGMSSNQEKWSIKFNVSSYYFLFAVYIFLDLFQNNRNQRDKNLRRQCLNLFHIPHNFGLKPSGLHFFMIRDRKLLQLYNQSLS